MRTFGPDPEYRFAFGLRTTGVTHRDRFGALATEPVEPWEFVYQLGDIGAWGVGFRDDDLVPVGASPGERDDVVDKVTKALDSTGMVVSISSANLCGHPVFCHGAFTSADRDVRRYAIQKAMRAIDLGTELGAQLHELSGADEATESIAAKPPLDALDRLREAVDFLCGYAREQGYPARFALRSHHPDGQGHALLSTIGHALAFIATLDHPEMVGLGPVIAQGSVAVSGECHGVAQAIDARKLYHVRLNAQPSRHDDRGPAFGAIGVRDVFLLVKLLEESGYDGPRHFDVDPSCFDDGAEMWDFTAGCMRTYRAFAAKASRFADDPEIRDALAACGALELAEPSVGPFSVDVGRALATECFDPSEMAQRRYRDQRLDQLVIDLVLGLR